MNNSDTISTVLSSVLICMVVLLIVLIITYMILSTKTKDKKKTKGNNIINKNGKGNKDVTDVKERYNKQSIFKFMEFDDIIDNMIVQRGGKRFVMVIECQGINYDLMSKVEKAAVEEGFQQFLNTLRHPIQIYIQTRTINLENSIKTYKEKINQIENDYKRSVFEFNQIKGSDSYTQEQKVKAQFELTKKRNLLEYGRDVVQNTEKMSLNNSVLTKKYYIVISYTPEDVSNYIKEEVINMAFSELFTKSQAIIRTLSGCSVQGKILNSYELLELMYVAFNREDSEVYGIDKALKAQYDDLYSTSVDVFDKKIEALNDEIERKAIEIANNNIEKAKSKKQKMFEEKEKRKNKLISEMVNIILEENKAYVGKDIINEAKKEIEEERGVVDVQEQNKKTGRTTKKS